MIKTSLTCGPRENKNCIIGVNFHGDRNEKKILENALNYKKRKSKSDIN